MRPLRHAIELFLLQKHFLVHINFNNKFDTEMALTHNLFVNVDEFANMGPSQQAGHEIPELREKANQQGTCLLSLFKNGENMLKSMWKTFIKRVLSQQSV